MASASDPRSRNEIFDLSSIGTYKDAYVDRLRQVMSEIDDAALGQACTVIEEAARSGRRIYAIGNGGSAAIADHLCCDWTKGTHVHDAAVIDTTSLSANTALYSALANDFGFESVFSRQLEWLGKEGDVLIAISSSGNSANIVTAVEMARQKGMTTIGFSGFTGGKLRDAADVVIHINVSNYGIVEDAHQMAIHIIAQYIAGHRDQREPHD